MLSPDYKDTNNKLDEQINKLRKCKAEMLEMFNELDSLTNESSLNNSICNDYSLNSSYKSECIDCLKCDNVLSSESESTISNYDSDNCSSDDSYLKRSSKNSLNKNYSPARMKFSYKIPSNSASFSNRPLSSMSLQTANKYSNSFQDFKPPRPAWVPNGKFKSSNLKNLSQSSNSLNKLSLSRSSSNNFLNKTKDNQNLNPNLAKPWKPNGKFRAKSALFLSSQDLTKSSESLGKSERLKKDFKDPKDVGNGWKTVLGKPKTDSKVFSQPNVEKDPIKKVIVKRKIIIDEKDIGGGWKTVLGKPKEDKKLLSQPEYEKTPFKSVVVKKKVVIDKNDVGKGWKPFTKSTEDLKVYESKKKDDPNLDQKDEIKNEKKSFKDQKDLGKGWKPAGNLKEDLKKVYYKPPVPEQTTKTIKNKKDLLNTQSKKWIPPHKNKKDKHPNTWIENAYLKNIQEAKSKTNLDKNKPKSKSNEKIFTSTPNISKNFDEKELEESMIEKSDDKNGQLLSTNRSNNSELNKNEVNEKIDDLDKKIETLVEEKEEIDKEINSENKNQENSTGKIGKQDDQEIKIDDEDSVKSENLAESQLENDKENNNVNKNDSVFKRVDTNEQEDEVSVNEDEENSENLESDVENGKEENQLWNHLNSDEE